MLLAADFTAWWARENTLSIHSINTTPREVWYSLAVLVTFDFGTALGDRTLEPTGWSPGTAILLPAGLIALVALGWRMGVGPVLSFWMAHILTRPRGADIGGFFALDKSEDDLVLGTLIATVIFLSTKPTATQTRETMATTKAIPATVAAQTFEASR